MKNEILMFWDWVRDYWFVWLGAGVGVIFAILLLFFWGGISRSCSSMMATARGSDWVIAQYDLAGYPYRCWELHDTSVANEANTDGIYWEAESGNLVHISGFYTRVQVKDDKWDDAFKTVGVTSAQCTEIRSRTIDDGWK